MKNVTIGDLAAEYQSTPSAIYKWLVKHGFAEVADIQQEGSCRRFYFSPQVAQQIRDLRDKMFAFKYLKTGDTFGRLTIDGPYETKMRGQTTLRYFPCVCTCGNKHVVEVQDLRKGKVQSCGCLKKETSNSAKSHGWCCGGSSRLYRILRLMKERCYNPRCASYKNYGGRGIFICPEWHDFAVFRAWALSAGYVKDLTIDRIDVNGSYHAGNCRWTTMVEQNNNRRSNVFIKAWGEEKTMMQWTRDERCVVDYRALRGRLQNLNWEPERAISKPSRQSH